MRHGIAEDIRFVTETTEVEFGLPFEVVVVRTWDADAQPEPWNEKSLTPLTVRLVESSRHVDAGRVEETLRYECRAFTLEDIALDAPTPGGEGLAVKVLASVDWRSPGEAELPHEPFVIEQPFSWGMWAGLGLGLIGALVLTVWIRHRRAQPAPGSEPLAPEERGRRRLAQLRAKEPRDREELDAFYVEAAALVREYFESKYAQLSPEMTTEDFLLGAPAPTREDLTAILGACDQVKFARRMPTVGERAELLDGVESLLERAVPSTEEGAAAT